MHNQTRERDFLLLQINDALFPIGGYSHSYGLESYIQKDLVHDETSATRYLHQYLRYPMLTNNLLTVRLAYEACVSEDLSAIGKLEEQIAASISPREIREAGKKLGSRFIKTLSSLDIPFQTNFFVRYIKQQTEKTISHTCAYGVFCAAVGIKKQRMLENYLYAQTSVMVTNCVKSVPLSQTSGQKILRHCYPLFDQMLKQLETMDESWLFAASPGFDIRCMQHEDLYSRIYMS